MKFYCCKIFISPIESNIIIYDIISINFHDMCRKPTCPIDTLKYSTLKSTKYKVHYL